jgi:hypothetical protein
MTDKQKDTVSRKVKLDEKFITNIQGKDFVTYNGLLDVAHQMGLKSLEVEISQFPTNENGMEAIAKATATGLDGQVFVEWGDSSPKNTNRKIAVHVLRMAATRAKARALRDFTNVGMTAAEELGDDVDDGIPAIKTKSNGKSRRTNGGNGAGRGNGSHGNSPSQPGSGGNGQQAKPARNAKQPGNGNNGGQHQQTQQSGPLMSETQKRAVMNLSRRRGITDDGMNTMLADQFGTGATIENLLSADASKFIRHLQTAA